MSRLENLANLKASRANDLVESEQNYQFCSLFVRARLKRTRKTIPHPPFTFSDYGWPTLSIGGRQSGHKTSATFAKSRSKRAKPSDFIAAGVTAGSAAWATR